MRRLRGRENSMLKVEQLCAGYGALEVLHSVSFEVPARSIVAVLGANGAGKTTLMRALTGLIRTRSGTVSLQGERIERLAAERRVRYGMALVRRGANSSGRSPCAKISSSGPLHAG